MNDLLKPVASDEHEDFNDYYDDWFDLAWTPENFDRFKRIARSAYQLWDSWDPLDYEAVKCLCSPQVDGPAKVALVCYNHNETWFREEVVNWTVLATPEEGINEEPEWKYGSYLFTRKKCYKQC